MAQLLVLLLARLTYGWHQARAYYPVHRLREQMGCDPRTFRLAREQAMEAGLLETGRAFVRGARRTWWTLCVEPACQRPSRGVECKNAPSVECKNAPYHVSKEKDQRKHHQHEDDRLDQVEDDDDLLIDQEMDLGDASALIPVAPPNSPASTTQYPTSNPKPSKPVLTKALIEARAFAVPPAAAHLVEELRQWGINGRIAARIVNAQPAEKLERALQAIRERPHVRNPAGWLVAECEAQEAYSLPGSTRAAHMHQREKELRAARRAQERTSKEKELAENDRHLEMVAQLVAELTQDERAELEGLAMQRVRRLSSKAGASSDCPILQAEFRNLVLERHGPRPSSQSADGTRWAGFRISRGEQQTDSDGRK